MIAGAYLGSSHVGTTCDEPDGPLDAAPGMETAMRSLFLVFALMLTSFLAAADRGTDKAPLRVLLVPADGGTEEGTKADFVPVFTAITRTTGMHFDIRVGQSYASVVEAMANAQVDIAFFGAVTYLQAKKRGGAELLAVSVEKGDSVYYAGVFVRPNSGMKTYADLKGKSLAVGDVNSTSSFAYPMAMLMANGVDPINDLGKIVIAGSHANSLAALNEGKIDIAFASFDSFEKALQQGTIKAENFHVLAKSDPIPNPPMAMHPTLPAATKAKLREAFATIHSAPGVNPEMIRGYGGKKVDRYDSAIKEEVFETAGARLSIITDDLKAAVLRKAGK